MASVWVGVKGTALLKNENENIENVGFFFSVCFSSCLLADRISHASAKVLCLKSLKCFSFHRHFKRPKFGGCHNHKWRTQLLMLKSIPQVHTQSSTERNMSHMIDTAKLITPHPHPHPPSTPWRLVCDKLEPRFTVSVDCRDTVLGWVWRKTRSKSRVKNLLSVFRRHFLRCRQRILLGRWSYKKGQIRFCEDVWKVWCKMMELKNSTMSS